MGGVGRELDRMNRMDRIKATRPGPELPILFIMFILSKICRRWISPAFLRAVRHTE
jgi:hypothetical protein